MHIGINSKKIDITSEKDNNLISKKISKLIKQGDVFLLYGEIGIGKTTFIKNLINCLQIKSKEKETEIPSPTFSILNEYMVGNLKISHYDLYRIKNKKELKNIGLFENYKTDLTFVEWPELITKKPKNRIELFFSYEDNFKKRGLVIKTDTRKKIVNEFR